MQSVAVDIKCSCCKKIKKPTLFYSSERTAKKPKCKACDSRRSSILYSRNKKHVLKKPNIAAVKYKLPHVKAVTERTLRADRLKRQYNTLKNKAFKLLGNMCKRCKIKDKRVLQVDHVKGGGTKERKKVNSLKLYKKIINKEKGYQLLCANCNWIKKFNRREK
jgi:hypothetical protein